MQQSSLHRSPDAQSLIAADPSARADISCKKGSRAIMNLTPLLTESFS